MSNLKERMKYLLLRSVDAVASLDAAVAKGGILLMRLDAIGDYILFRNFIEHISQSDRYRNKKITLLGNIAFQELAVALETERIAHFIWVNPKKFRRNLAYRWHKMKEILRCEYDEFINPDFSPDFNAQTLIALAVRAEVKIGHRPNESNLFGWQVSRANLAYKQLIDTGTGVLFEFERNKRFAEKLTKTICTIRAPFISYVSKTTKVPISKPYAVLFIGAGQPIRKWHPAKFGEVATFLQNTKQLRIVLMGGPDSRTEAKQFAKFFVGEYTDLVGKTNLTDLLDVLKASSVLVSGETSVPHMAMALGVPKVFVLSNGNHFGRFVPYPREMCTGYYPIFHSSFSELLKTGLPHGEFVSPFPVEEIESAQVIHALKNALN